MEIDTLFSLAGVLERQVEPPRFGFWLISFHTYSQQVVFSMIARMHETTRALLLARLTPPARQIIQSAAMSHEVNHNGITGYGLALFLVLLASRCCVS